MKMLNRLKYTVIETFRKGWRFMFRWSAFFGLFISTSNCPCCGQPACPKGAAIMGALSLIPAMAMGLFRKKSALPGARQGLNETDEMLKLSE